MDLYVFSAFHVKPAQTLHRYYFFKDRVVKFGKSAPTRNTRGKVGGISNIRVVRPLPLGSRLLSNYKASLVDGLSFRTLNQSDTQVMSCVGRDGLSGTLNASTYARVGAIEATLQDGNGKI